MYYYVQPGDSMYSIARTYNTTVSHLMSLNPQIRNPHRLYVGEKIKVNSGYWGQNRWVANAYQRGREEYRKGREEYRKGLEEYSRHRSW